MSNQVIWVHGNSGQIQEVGPHWGAAWDIRLGSVLEGGRSVGRTTLSPGRISTFPRRASPSKRRGTCRSFAR